VFEERYANGSSERVASLIDELLALNVNVLVTPGTPITLAAHRATSTVPIVCVTADPVRTGLAESLARPGGNITGVSLLSGDYSVKWLELLREAVPTARRVAVLWNPDNPATLNQSKLIRAGAVGLGLEITALSMRSADLEDSFAALVTASFDGFVVTDDPLIATCALRLIATTLYDGLRPPRTIDCDHLLRLIATT